MKMGEIVMRSTNELHPYEKNAKIHLDDQVNQIAASIKEFGWKQPLVIDKDDVVVIGHGRLEAAKKLGLAEVPCVIADDLTPDQIKALRLADNKSNESPWDFNLLGEELDELSDLFDMSNFGFTTDEQFDADKFFEDTDTPTKEDREEEQVTCPHCGKTFAHK